MTDSFATAMRDLERADFATDRFSHPFLSVFPVTGVAVSTLGDVLGSETLSATDAQAVRLDELQFDLGEGPCWDALRLVQPVAEPSVRTAGRSRWPAFAAAIRGEAVCSIFAFPLAVGTLRLGAVDLYSTAPLELDQTQTQHAAAMADVVGRHVLRDALASADHGIAAESESPFSRRLTHQATGVVLAQLDLSPEDAHLIIQGHAFATSRSMMEVASDITEGRLRFVRREGRIEAIQ